MVQRVRFTISDRGSATYKVDDDHIITRIDYTGHPCRGFFCSCGWRQDQRWARTNEPAQNHADAVRNRWAGSLVGND